MQFRRNQLTNKGCPYCREGVPQLESSRGLLHFANKSLHACENPDGLGKKEELLKLLLQIAENPNIRNVVDGHQQAEELLLEIINDPEVTAAWEAAADRWFYA